MSASGSSVLNAKPGVRFPTRERRVGAETSVAFAALATEFRQLLAEVRDSRLHLDH